VPNPAKPPSGSPFHPRCFMVQPVCSTDEPEPAKSSRTLVRLSLRGRSAVEDSGRRQPRRQTRRITEKLVSENRSLCAPVPPCRDRRKLLRCRTSSAQLSQSGAAGP
jgi:hypothetical protein